ncbi:MAG: efflux RND transporter periplasmic adaptor subunit [Candidatus Hydrogenedentes bacterium]|nr:efflux RND transporter periplasmic adaptor subunit [Candidatus Hydrogenedentota bacterium]
MKHNALNWINRIGLVAGLGVAAWLGVTGVMGVTKGPLPEPLEEVHAEAAGEHEHAAEGEEHALHESPAAALEVVSTKTDAVDTCCPPKKGVVEKAEGHAGGTPPPRNAAEAQAEEEGHEGHAHGAEEHDAGVHAEEADHAGHEHGDEGHAVGAPGEAWCGEHDVAEAQCAICQPGRTADLKPGESLLLRMVSETSAEKSGVRVGFALAGGLDTRQELLGEVTYNQARRAHITPRVTGRIEEVFVSAGETVEAGTPLVRMSSPEIAAAKEALLTAVSEGNIASKRLASEQQLWEAKATARQAVDEAQATQQKSAHRVAAARQQLLNMGLSEGDVADVLKNSSTSAEVIVAAPFEGTLVEQHAVLGELAQPGVELFTLADLTSMWLQMAIPVQRAGSVQPGDHVAARFEGLGDRVFDASVEWVSPEVDSATRTVAARAVLDNSEGTLRSGLYGRMRLDAEDGEPSTSVRVPLAAVQHYDDRPYVFVQEAPDLFEVRQVRIGSEAAGEAEVLEGLGTDESVVLEGAYLVKSEFLKARLGAGCTDH